VDDGQVQHARTEGRRRHINEVVGGQIELAGGRAQRDGLATPTLQVITPKSDSAMQKRMRETASWWLERSHS
jgi:hypothetical protein